MNRGTGVLLHITSLPDKRGAGCFSKSAFDFIDFLHEAKCKYWQVLAFGPTGYGDSPYAPLSVFAGNPVFIDKDLSNRGYDKSKLAAFIKENKFWVEQYALYSAIKAANNYADWRTWPEQLRDPKNIAVAAFLDAHREEVNFHISQQMLFFEQWAKVKQYANERGIQIIGDVPIYPAMDSADVWANRELFMFDGNNPTAVAGVPPDYFNENGQLWGNPVYNFKKMGANKYKWWTERLRHTQKMFDVLRLDHFRAFDTYYCILPDSPDAKEGKWVKGPGMKFFNALKTAAPNMQIILEDLGDLSESVLTLRDKTGFPGMKVMQFGFDGQGDNEHLPVNYPKNCVAYIGTHDNDTFVGFLKSLNAEQRKIVDGYLHSENLCPEDVTRLALEDIIKSRADTVILTMQDLLFQDSRSRMNLPGSLGGNWQYQISPLDLPQELCLYLRMLIELGNRT